MDPIPRKKIRKKKQSTDSELKPHIGGDENGIVRESHYLIIIHNYIKNKYDIRYNIMSMSTEYRVQGSKDEYQEVTSHIKNDLWIEMTLAGVKQNGRDINDTTIDKIVNSSYFIKRHHPLQDYLNNLKWDGQDHIAKLASTLFLSNDPDLYVDGKSQSDLFPVLLKRWLINSAAIAVGISSAGLGHVMLILEGRQGKGKTTWLNNICPPELRQLFGYSGHIVPNITDQNTGNLLAEKWFVNVDDQLQGLMSKDFNNIKSMITAPDVTNRKSYDRNMKKRQRTASWMASVNGREIFTDIENRRYFCFCIDNEKAFCFDENEYAKINHNQVWAQVMALLSQGEKFFFTGEEMKIINAMNLMFSQTKPEEEWLIRCFTPTNHADPEGIGFQAGEMLSICKKISGLNLNAFWFIRALEKYGFIQIRKKMKEYNHQVRKIYFAKSLYHESEDGSYFFPINKETDKEPEQAEIQFNEY